MTGVFFIDIQICFFFWTRAEIWTPNILEFGGNSEFSSRCGWGSLSHFLLWTTDWKNQMQSPKSARISTVDWTRVLNQLLFKQHFTCCFSNLQLFYFRVFFPDQVHLFRFLSSIACSQITSALFWNLYYCLSWVMVGQEKNANKMLLALIPHHLF